MTAQCCPAPVPPDPAHDARIVCEQWHRVLGCGEEAVAAADEPDDLADELTSLWAAERIRATVDQTISRLREIARRGTGRTA